MIKGFLTNKFIILSIGSIVGSVIRWKIEDIFLLNIFGCFVLGFVNRVNLHRDLKLLIGFSFCGSLTTFSSWIFNLFLLIKEALYLKFVIDTCFSLIIAIFGIYFGDILGKKINSLIKNNSKIF